METLQGPNGREEGDRRSAPGGGDESWRPPPPGLGRGQNRNNNTGPPGLTNNGEQFEKPWGAGETPNCLHEPDLTCQHVSFWSQLIQTSSLKSRLPEKSSAESAVHTYLFKGNVDLLLASDLATFSVVASPAPMRVPPLWGRCWA